MDSSRRVQTIQDMVLVCPEASCGKVAISEVTGYGLTCIVRILCDFYDFSLIFIKIYEYCDIFWTCPFTYTTFSEQQRLALGSSDSATSLSLLFAVAKQVGKSTACIGQQDPSSLYPYCPQRRKNQQIDSRTPPEQSALNFSSHSPSNVINLLAALLDLFKQSHRSRIVIAFQGSRLILK